MRACARASSQQPREDGGVRAHNRELQMVGAVPCQHGAQPPAAEGARGRQLEAMVVDAKGGIAVPGEQAIGPSPTRQ